ncbi:MAG: hypothetical protein J7L15_02190 [Clostridiales bacterium]|nr:hypothetical protein [Clostridiales bacterium]
MSKNTQSGIGAIIDQFKKDVGLSKKYSAVVEGIGNKDKPGQVQLRVAGVHPSSKKVLSTESLPWQKVVQTVGSGGGIGDSINLQVGQWVEVEAATPGASSWKVIRNIPAVPSSDKGDGAYGQVAEGDDDKLESEIEPMLGSGDITKLAKTAWGMVNSGLLSSFVGGGTPPAEASPPIEIPNFTIDAPDFDWTTDPDKAYNNNTLTLVNLRDIITVDGHRPNSEVVIELIDGANGHPGDAVGYDTSSNPIYIKLVDDSIQLPRLMLKPGDVDRNITIEYKAIRYDNTKIPPEPFTPLNESEGSISILLSLTPRSRGITPTPRSGVGSGAKSVALQEDPDTADKTEPAKSKVWQSPDGLISERKDFTEGNVSWGTTVMTKKGDTESLSRISMGPTGITTIKSASDMVLISKKNLQMYIENEVEQTIKTMMTIHCPVTKIKGDVRIEGDLHIVGNITHNGNVDQTGSQVTSGEVTASGIKLSTHKHKEVGGTDSGMDTSSPNP